MLKKIFYASLVMLVLGGVWFFNFYFSSTDEAIRHAEAFVFRRMKVAELSEQGQYRFLYATNRVSGDLSGQLEDRFTNKPGETLKFGTFDAEIKPSLGLGMLINPTEWFQNEEINLQSVSTLEREKFVGRLRDLVEASPHRGIFVVLHGFRERYPSALRKTAFIGHVLDINAPVLLFDWPGNQGSSLRGYRQAREVASASGPQLAELLEIIVNEVQPENIWLMANSMGAQVVVDAFSLLYQNPDMRDAQAELTDVILTAPDIDHQQFNEQFKHEISALTRNLAVYVSSNDRALLVSRLVNRGKRGGESTLSPDQFDEAERVLQLTEAGEDQVTLIDVTPVNRTRNFHNFSLETPEFYDDLYLRLINKETPKSRLLYRVETPDGRVYSILTRGR